jgi:hypothetical protein
MSTDDVGGQGDRRLLELYERHRGVRLTDVARFEEIDRLVGGVRGYAGDPGLRVDEDTPAAA